MVLKIELSMVNEVEVIISKKKKHREISNNLFFFITRFVLIPGM